MRMEFWMDGLANGNTQVSRRGQKSAMSKRVQESKCKDLLWVLSRADPLQNKIHDSLTTLPLVPPYIMTLRIL